MSFARLPLALAIVALPSLVQADGYQLKVLEGHGEPVTAVAFSPDGKQLATGSWDMSAQLWSLPSGEPGNLFDVEDLGNVTFVGFLNGGKALLMGVEVFYGALPDYEKDEFDDASHDFFIWKLTDPPEQIKFRATLNVVDAAIAPDGATVGYALGEGKVMDSRYTIEGNTFSAASGRSVAAAGPLRSVVYSPNGKQLATSSVGEKSNVVQLWDAASNKVTGTLAGTGLHLAYSPDGRLLATDDKIWDLPSKKVHTTLEHSERIDDLVFSRDGKWLFTIGAHGRLKAWDVSTGKLVATIRAHDEPITDLAISPDGKILATASFDETAKLWDAEKIVAERPDDPTVKFQKDIAADPLSIDAWKLARSWCDAVRTRARLKNAGVELTEEAESALFQEPKRASAALGVDLPELPDETTLGETVQYLFNSSKPVGEEIEKKHGIKRVASYGFPLFCDLLDTIYDPMNEAIAEQFSGQLDAIGEAAGFPPELIKPLTAKIRTKESKSDVVEALDRVECELDLLIAPAQGPAEVAGTQWVMGDGTVIDLFRDGQGELNHGLDEDPVSWKQEGNRLSIDIGEGGAQYELRVDGDRMFGQWTEEATDDSQRAASLIRIR